MTSGFEKLPLQCERCDSTRVIPDAKLADLGQYAPGVAQMMVESKPSAMIFKGTKTAQVKGALCCDCGHLQLYCVGDLNALWQAWQASQV